MRPSLCRALLAGAASAVVLTLSAGPAAADKLVVFKNGKAMRVKSVQNEGKWMKCEFEDKNFISVLASTVADVEEAVSSSSAGELRPTQVASSSGGGGGGYSPPPQAANPSYPPEISQAVTPIPEAPTEQDAQAELEAEQAAIQAEQRTGGLRRYGAQPQQAPGGLQPLNNNVLQRGTLPGRGLARRDQAQGAPTTPRGSSLRDRLSGNNQQNN